MSLTVQEQILIEQRVSNDAKSTGVSYLLWLFLGGFGVHRFYLGRTGTGALMLLLNLVGWATLLVGIGAFCFIILGCWLLVDLFLIPGMIRTHKEKIRSDMQLQFMMLRGPEVSAG